MAYVDTDQSEEQENLQPQQNAQANGAPVQLSTGASGSPAGGSGTGATHVATPVTQGAPSSSGNFTNLQTYLNANQTGANSLAGKVASGVSNSITGAANTITDQGNQFNTSVGAGTVNYNPDLISSATSDPTDFINNSSDMSQLAAQKAGQYSGPSAWENSANATTAQTAALQAQQQAQLTGTTGGRETLITQDNSDPYTQGGLSLNQFLIQNTPGALSQVTSAATPAANLTDQFNTTQTNADNSVTGGQQTSANTATQTNKALTGAVNDYRSQIDQAVSGAQTAQQGQFTNLLNALAPAAQPAATTVASANAAPSSQSYNVTAQQLQQMGLTSDQWNQLVQLNNQAIAAGDPGVNLSNYLTNTPGQFTESSVATPDQQAYFAALNQLAGTGQSLNSGGTAGGSAYDLSGAYNALLAELQAKAPTGNLSPSGTTSSSSNTASSIGAGAGLANVIGQIGKLLNPPASTGPNTTAAQTGENTDINNVINQTAPNDNTAGMAATGASSAIQSGATTPATPSQGNISIENPDTGEVYTSTAGAAAGAAGAGALGAAAAGAAAPVGVVTISPVAGTAFDAITSVGSDAAAGAAADAAADAGAGAAGAGGSMAAIAPVLGALGAFAGIAAPLIMGLTTPAVQLTPQYWQGMASALTGNNPNVNTSPGGGGAAAAQYAISDAVQEALGTPQNLVPPGIQQMVWATGLVPYGTWGFQVSPGAASSFGGEANIGARRTSQE